MRKKFYFLILALFLIVAGGTFFIPLYKPPVINVLFVGNSYTYINDVPHLVSEMGLTDKNKIIIKAAMLAEGNANLEGWFARPQAIELLNSRRWDFVVLQEHSMRPVIPELSGRMRQAFQDWDRAIRATGAKTIIYQTWARKPGSSWYTDDRAPSLHFDSPEAMQEQVDRVTNEFAAEIQAPVVPVGDYILRCGKELGYSEFYDDDGTHLKISGSYLAALMLYRQLSGHNVDGVTYIPPNMSVASKDSIMKCI